MHRSVSDFDYVPLKLTKLADDMLTLFIAQGFIAIIYYGGINAREIFVYFYILPTTITTFITALILSRIHLLSTPILARKRKSKKRSRSYKKSAVAGDPGGEKPQPLATATPSLIISDTILGILFSLS